MSWTFSILAQDALYEYLPPMTKPGYETSEKKETWQTMP